MTSPSSSCAIRSILVALDDATADRDTIVAAVTLAADLEAELQGLFFENDALLRMAELPFVYEISTGSGTVREIDAKSMEQAMRNRAEQVRQVLERWADSAHIPCSFEVTRRRAMRYALSVCDESGVVFFGSRSHVPAVRPPMGLRTRSPARPLLLLVDNSPRNQVAMTAASTVAANHGLPIILLALAHGREEFDRLSSNVSESLCRQELAHTLLPHPISTVGALIQTVRGQRPHLLVLNRTCDIFCDATVESLLAQVDCPVVLA